MNNFVLSVFSGAWSLFTMPTIFVTKILVWYFLIYMLYSLCTKVFNSGHIMLSWNAFPLGDLTNNILYNWEENIYILNIRILTSLQCFSNMMKLLKLNLGYCITWTYIFEIYWFGKQGIYIQHVLCLVKIELKH